MRVIGLSFFILLFFYGCGGFEFVYNKHPIIKNLENKIAFQVSGDDSSVLVSKLNSKFGLRGDEGKYILIADVVRNIKPLVYEKDGTVSKQEVSHNITYTLLDSDEGCTIKNKKVFTYTNYNTASSGYNFSSDLSKKEIIERNIETNVDDYIDFIVSDVISLVCQSENIS